MPNISLPLDILKSSEEILMGAINEENRTSYDYNEFVYSNVTPVVLQNSEVNTSIVLTPKIGSLYYNSKTVYYRRMSFQEIYASSQIEIEIGSRTLLSELIPEINLYYGINLTEDDYIEQTLPVPDPLNPELRLSVVLQAKADSILFRGNVDLILNEASPVLDNDNVERKYFMVVDTEDTTVYRNTIVCINSDLIPVESFKPLKNATNITLFNIYNVIGLSNGNMVLRGEFEFNASINGPVQSYVVNQVIITPQGNVILATNDPIFGNVADIYKHYSHTDGEYIYVIDNNDTIGVQASKVYRYNLFGVLDTGFSITGITYVPTMLAISRSGKIYTVSDVYLDTTKKIRIDKLLSDGTIDTNFVPVIFEITSNDDPLSIADIKVVDGGGFYVVVNPIEGVSSIDPCPVINGVPVIPGGNTQIYAYNPVFKFLNTGAKDPNFNNELKNNAGVSIYKHTGSNMQVGDNVIAPNSNGVVFFTHTANPITGYDHRSPISFDASGNQIHISGNAYASQIRWDSAKQMHYQSNGKLVVYGKAMLRLPTGGWSELRSIVALYLKSGELDEIIYTTPNTTGPLLEVLDVVTMQLEY